MTNGIIFPIPIAPFEVVILPLQIHEPEVVEAAEKIYGELLGRRRAMCCSTTGT